MKSRASMQLDTLQREYERLECIMNEGISEKQRLDDENQTKVAKIKELEEELLKFKSASTKLIEAQSSTKRTAKERNARKPCILASKVKYMPLQMLNLEKKPQSLRSPKKKVTFTDYLESDSSPETVRKAVDSSSLFDEVIGKAQPPNQVAPTNQLDVALATYSSTSEPRVPTSGRKFIKSRDRQSK